MTSHYPVDAPGATLIVMKNHELLFSGAYGMADLETGRSMTPETVLRIGSMTKQFTAICILKCQDEGLLLLDDLVTDYYPKLFADLAPISIRDLLTHQSGIIDLPKVPGIRELMTTDSEPDDLVKLISAVALEFEPCTDHNYSNSGYVVLGGILEKVTGKDFDQLLSEWIFKPLSMSASSFENQPEEEIKAKGYFGREEGFVMAPEIHSSLLLSAGGLWSTSKDLASWNEALYSNAIVSHESLESVFTPQPLSDGRMTDYGFGFRRCQVNGMPSIEHGGGVFGYSCYGIRIEEEGVYVAILTNFERNNAYDKVCPKIAALVSGIPYPVKPRFMSTPTQKIESIAGKYVRDDGDNLNLIYENEQLTIRRGGRDDLYLLYTGDNAFIIKGSLEDKVTFVSSGDSDLIWKPRRSMAMFARKIED
jgi:CubicO group peptidase (beta-lactamase class C family)